jgi:hypothetical protein
LIALFDRIPYGIEQGKILAEQGIDSAEQGILLRHQRNADISESLQARPWRSNGDASIVIPAEGFRPSNERSFTDRVFGASASRACRHFTVSLSAGFIAGSIMTACAALSLA